MRSTLQTPFWQRAYESLPRDVRARYRSQMQSAERLELTLDAIVDSIWRAKGFLSGLFKTPGKPRSAH